jgi:hypothetical protein
MWLKNERFRSRLCPISKGWKVAETLENKPTGLICKVVGRIIPSDAVTDMRILLSPNGTPTAGREIPAEVGMNKETTSPASTVCPDSRISSRYGPLDWMLPSDTFSLGHFQNAENFGPEDPAAFREFFVTYEELATILNGPDEELVNCLRYKTNTSNSTRFRFIENVRIKFVTIPGLEGLNSSLGCSRNEPMLSVTSTSHVFNGAESVPPRPKNTSPVSLCKPPEGSVTPTLEGIKKSKIRSPFTNRLETIVNEIALSSTVMDALKSDGGVLDPSTTPA